MYNVFHSKKKEKNMNKIGLLLFMLLIANFSHADITVDENGVGFVGKGDVQSIYGWNNADLQANVQKIIFRLSTTTSAKWICAGYNGANKYTTMKKSSESNKVSVGVSYTARRNSQAQVTGFILKGRDVTIATAVVPGTCPPANGWVVQPTLIPESLQYEGNGEYVLEVSNGDGFWHELVITPVILI